MRLASTLCWQSGKGKGTDGRRRQRQNRIRVLRKQDSAGCHISLLPSPLGQRSTSLPAARLSYKTRLTSGHRHSRGMPRCIRRQQRLAYHPSTSSYCRRPSSVCSAYSLHSRKSWPKIYRQHLLRRPRHNMPWKPTRTFLDAFISCRVRRKRTAQM